MEALDRLAGGLAHDFNNLLTVIKGHSDLLLNNLPPQTVEASSVLYILSTANRAAALTQRLLAYSRQNPIKLKTIDIRTLLTGLHGMLDRLVPANISLRVIQAAKQPYVFADAGQLEQILINLVVNSCDAMPDGGTIIIETSKLSVGVEDLQEFPELRAGRHLVLSVTDTGRGMDNETLLRAFEPFFTTKNPGEGTGLGLSLVFGLVKQHRGCVRVTSSAGEGTSVRMWLPESTRIPGPSESASRSAFPGTENVLVVDDEADICHLVSAVLQKQGYSVIEASSPQEAIALCNHMRENIDLLISDVVMREQSGPQMVKLIRQAGSKTKVLFMSGYANDSVFCESLEKFGFLAKPFSPAELLDKVRALLDA